MRAALAYASGVHGRWPGLRGVPAGGYVLRQRANPRGFLRQGNGLSVLLLDRPEGERPRVRVLASCPGPRPGSEG